jgi:hypothetical protein
VNIHSRKRKIDTQKNSVPTTEALEMVCRPKRRGRVTRLLLRPLLPGREEPERHAATEHPNDNWVEDPGAVLVCECARDEGEDGGSGCEWEMVESEKEIRVGSINIHEVVGMERRVNSICGPDLEEEEREERKRSRTLTERSDKPDGASC